MNKKLMTWGVRIGSLSLVTGMVGFLTMTNGLTTPNPTVQDKQVTTTNGTTGQVKKSRHKRNQSVQSNPNDTNGTVSAPKPTNPNDTKPTNPNNSNGTAVVPTTPNGPSDNRATFSSDNGNTRTRTGGS